MTGPLSAAFGRLLLTLLLCFWCPTGHWVTRGVHFAPQIEAVVRRMLWLGQAEPGCKILVFSEWMDVLVRRKEIPRFVCLYTS